MFTHFKYKIKKNNTIKTKLKLVVQQTKTSKSCRSVWFGILQKLS